MFVQADYCDQASATSLNRNIVSLNSKVTKIQGKGPKNRLTWWTHITCLETSAFPCFPKVTKPNTISLNLLPVLLQQTYLMKDKTVITVPLLNLHTFIYYASVSEHVSSMQTRK